MEPKNVLAVIFWTAFAILLVLKLAGVAISWWLVFAPLWVPLGISLVMFAIAGILLALSKALGGRP